jgi:23S rRNA pseudouridine1911/1915/1917 synthase
MQTLSVSHQAFLLEYLLNHLPQLKKTKIKQILKYGSVRVNGRVVTSHRYPLRRDDTIDFLSQKGASLERLKTKLNFKIIEEDTDILVAEKPAGLLTIGTDREKEKTLYFMLTEYQRAKDKDGRGRIFIVHRLDRDVSGLIVFAKSEGAKQLLQRNWGRVVKKYYAVIEGVPKKKEDKIESHLVEDKFKRVYSISKPAREAKHAITHYRLIGENGRYALVDLNLETGRKNQIRVHLSDLGYPVVGDAKYGARSNPLGRLALHAYYLSFPHPYTGKLQTGLSKLPEGFEALL